LHQLELIIQRQCLEHQSKLLKQDWLQHVHNTLTNIGWLRHSRKEDAGYIHVAVVMQIINSYHNCFSSRILVFT